MNKVCHIGFGCRFEWVPNCYAVKFILTYDGSNLAVLRLQIRLIGWDVEIVHRFSGFLTDADYWLCLDANPCYNLLFCTYLCMCANLRSSHPPPKDLPMLPEHMPYYRGPHIVAMPKDAPQPTAISDAIAASTMAAIVLLGTSTCSSNHPIKFGAFPSTIPNAMEIDSRKSTTQNTLSSLSEHCTLSGPSTHLNLAILLRLF
jgi:hypothetical protein